MPTVATSATSYASVSDLFVHVDWRLVADWVSDGDGPRPLLAALQSATSVPGATLAAKLLSASGELESACLRGGQYTVADLQALTGSTREFLRAVVASLALWQLARRRNPGTAAKDVPGAQAAIDTLEALRKGERVFGLADQIDAGAGPTAVELVVNDGTDERRTVTTASRFFGNRDRG